MTRSDHRNVARPLPLRVEDFFTLDDSGAFEGYGKTELLDGGVVYINAQHRPHARCKAALYDGLRDALRAMNSPLSVLIEASVTMPPHDAPEPDLVLTSEPDGPGPVPLASVALIVEVSDATLASDLGTKATIYARHDVPEYWVADIAGKRIVQHSQPTAQGYGNRSDVAFGAVIEAATVAGLKVATDTL